MAARKGKQAARKGKQAARPGKPTSRKGTKEKKAARRPQAHTPKAAAGRADLVHARHLLPQAKAVLFHFPGVIGVGVGTRRSKAKNANEVVFVVSVEWAPPKTGRKLPETLLGVPVDVQITSLPSLRSTISGGGVVRGAGRTKETGRIGFIAAHANGDLCAITAYHVLMADELNSVTQLGDPSPLDAEVENGAGFERLGPVVAAQFREDSDVACIDLDAAHTASAALLGSDVVLAEPAEPHALGLPTPVRLVVAGRTPVEVEGSLIHYPVHTDVQTEQSRVRFDGLMQFVLKVKSVPHGWSGSLIFDPADNRPIALLSFAADGSAPGGNSYAFGFPINPHYQVWGLTPV
jgi:hypothetical protein